MSILRLAPAWARRNVRSSEAGLVLLAIAVGAGAGVLSVVQGAIARTLQHLLFALNIDERLSSATGVPALALLALPLGGLVLAGFSWATGARRRRMVDAVEANALHGGRMSWSDSLVISGQTIISNGFGASVGLEAAYAQLGAGLASVGGGWLRLRRGDLRVLVGAGTGAAIAGAFGAPLAGAFYAFEIVIGAYTPAAIAPVAAAALTGVLVAQMLGAQPYLVDAVAGEPVLTHHYLIYAGLGAVAALLGIVLMRAVAEMETLTRRLPVDAMWRPAIGGVLLIPLALLTPQILSAGHGALHLDLEYGLPLSFLAAIFIMKSAASVVSLGFGFRGGLFFASLFLGSLLGHIYADAIAWAAGTAVIDPQNAALVGMAAFAVAVVGGPMTMAMLVLEATHDFSLAGATIAASLVTTTIVRETFGYSFSTWRLHLRGETIKSARDVGWMRTLTAGRMMRRVERATPARMSIAEFRRAFPLGSTSRVVLVDDQDHYAGIIQTARAYADGLDPGEPIGTLAIQRDQALAPDADVKTVMSALDAAGADEMAVIGGSSEVLGLVSEPYVRRRYAEELDKAQRELFGEH
ncbi:chloride channel protein [Sphingomonas sp. Leaf21]|uniref:chloride channel protein n=1 Tax=Sphingomonas sp. Leaf21 TaxID=2876550 RepID=UPI001E645BB8|nr:chloride channel protein [Sphingomonas sp. Leaf21]